MINLKEKALNLLRKQNISWKFVWQKFVQPVVLPKATLSVTERFSVHYKVITDDTESKIETDQKREREREG